MAEYIDRETILDDLEIDIQVTNKKRCSAKRVIALKTECVILKDLTI